MEVTYRVTAHPHSLRPVGIARDDHLVCVIPQTDCDATHFGDVTVDFIREGMAGMAAAGEVRDLQCERTHSLDVRDDLHGTDDRAKVASDGRVQAQQTQAGFFHSDTGS